MLIVNILFLIVGLYILVKGADFLIDGSASIAKKYKVSPLMIGLTVVAFGTSMPELMINVVAALEGSTGVAMGNVIGSNIANILLVLGAVALVKKIAVKKSVINKEIPFSIFSTVLLLVIINSRFLAGEGTYISKTNGYILLSFFVLFMIYLFQTSRKPEIKPVEEEVQEIEKVDMGKSLGYIALGILGLYFGSEWAVNNAVVISQMIGLSEFAISASVIAVGTSLPELVTSVSAARQNNLDLAVGNIVGSNIFNILWILGVTSAIRPIAITRFVNLDLVILLFVSLFFLISITFQEDKAITKKMGITYLSIYALYIIFLFIRN